jgi:hypothetical protein
MIVSVLNVAHSKETEIATVLNDETKTIYKLVLVDHDDRKIINVFKDVYESGKKIRRDSMNPEIISQKGMVLEERKSHIVLQLIGQNFDLELGGMLLIDTLYNGVKGERKSYDVQLAKDKDGWKLFKNGKVVKELFIQTNKIKIFGSVGIKNVVMR